MIPNLPVSHLFWLSISLLQRVSLEKYGSIQGEFSHTYSTVYYVMLEKFKDLMSEICQDANTYQRERDPHFHFSGKFNVYA